VGKAGRPAAIYNWDLQVQQQVASDLILTIGYVGSAGQNLQANNQNINNIPYADLALGNLLGTNALGNSYGIATPFTGFYDLWGNGAQVQRALRPFPPVRLHRFGLLPPDDRALELQRSAGLARQAV
jgi:hypothetical protein